MLKATEGGLQQMARHVWPADTVFNRLELDVQDRACPRCSRRMKVCDHRHRKFFTLDGPLHLTCRLVQCSDKACPQHHLTVSPEEELSLALPHSLIAWDVLTWIGLRRFGRHWNVPQIRAELLDTYSISLSADTIEDSIRRYQGLVAARQADPAMLAQEYQGIDDVVLAIDGLQPEKGHETLYVVREVRRKRVWFAEALLSSSATEVQRLLVQSKEWTERLGKKVRGWLSDKQDAFLSGIAEVFPKVPHRLCHNHFLRGLAKPILEKDSHAKVQMRSKVRGLRELERQALARQALTSTPDAPMACEPPAPNEAFPLPEATPAPAAFEAKAADVAGAPQAAPVKTELAPAAFQAKVAPAPPASKDGVLLDYCCVVRGILNDDQGGPLHPPGVRMAEALQEVRDSLGRCLGEKKGGPSRGSCGGSLATSIEA
jgi:hypothetical protein